MKIHSPTKNSMSTLAHVSPFVAPSEIGGMVEQVVVPLGGHVDQAADRVENADFAEERFGRPYGTCWLEFL